MDELEQEGATVGQVREMDTVMEEGGEEVSRRD